MYTVFFKGRMQPSEENIEKSRFYDYGLEGLRGVAALWVGYAHVFNFENLLDPNFHPANQYIGDLHAAHAGVLLFFILSGYVIGLTNTKPCSKNRIFSYLVRRFIRLFPIYSIAIIISILAAPQDSWQMVFGNLFFLQPAFVRVLSSNPILWTLNYEVVYYLLFLLIWHYKPKSQYLFLATFAIATIGWIFPTSPQLLSAYASGFIFWLCGLVLAWKCKPNNNLNTFPLLSYFLIVAATNHFGVGKILLNGLGFVNKNADIINLSDLALLPICFLTVCSIANRKVDLKWLNIVSFSLPLLTTLFLFGMGRLWSNQNWIISSIYTLLSLILIKKQVTSKILKLFIYFGSISYAFYIFHMPIMYLIQDHFPLTGSWFSFVLRLITWFLLTVSISVVLELLIQPKIKLWSKKQLLMKLS